MYYKKSTSYKVIISLLCVIYISNIWNKTFLLNTIDNNNQSIPHKSKETPTNTQNVYYFLMLLTSNR